jgi:hypothetical protein
MTSGVAISHWPANHAACVRCDRSRDASQPPKPDVAIFGRLIGAFGSMLSNIRTVLGDAEGTFEVGFDPDQQTTYAA